MKTEEGFGVIVKDATCTSLFRLDAIQDYAPAVEKDIQINGLLC
jgi:hypothetical protein